jgi:hypothetical protein
MKELKKIPEFDSMEAVAQFWSAAVPTILQVSQAQVTAQSQPTTTV